VIEAPFRIAVTITFAIPAGTTEDQARVMLSQNGVSVALGLTPLIRQVDANIIPVADGPKLI